MNNNNNQNKLNVHTEEKKYNQNKLYNKKEKNKELEKYILDQVKKLLPEKQYFSSYKT